MEAAHWTLTILNWVHTYTLFTVYILGRAGVGSNLTRTMAYGAFATRSRWSGYISMLLQRTGTFLDLPRDPDTHGEQQRTELNPPRDNNEHDIRYRAWATD